MEEGSAISDLLLEIGDDALIAAQRLAEWCARAPEMEEDVALANIALDQLGVARQVLSLVGDEDELAFLREEHEFRNCLLVELPNGDFAVTITKLLFLSAYQKLRYDRLAEGDGDERLSAIAAKARKESAYHLDHATLWTVRLGDGTEESHRRMQRAVDDVWPYTYELRGDLGEEWLSIVEPVLAEATLTRPADGGWAPSGGRRGVHTEHFGYLVAEMQVLHRAHPGARW